MSHVMGPGILEFPRTLMEVAVFKKQSRVTTNLQTVKGYTSDLYTSMIKINEGNTQGTPLSSG